jgi:hypothetical protein
MQAQLCVGMGRYQAQGPVISLRAPGLVCTLWLLAACMFCLFTLTARTHQCALVPAFREAAYACCISILCLPCMSAGGLMHSICLLILVLHACTCMPLIPVSDFRRAFFKMVGVGVCPFGPLPCPPPVRRQLRVVPSRGPEPISYYLSGFTSSR